MTDLFTPVTRDERQEQAKRAWLVNKGRGTIVGCTGIGKTRIALNTIKALLEKYPSMRILVVTPTDLLKNQWFEHVDKWGFGLNVDVQVINTTAKNGYVCDLLVIDEIHRAPATSFSAIFSKVKYKLILGLTATVERLDGKHTIIEKYCPVVDEISLEVAKLNKWISDFTEYQVIITAKDIDIYKQYNKEFQQHFEFFDYQFDKVMSLVGKDGLKHRLTLRDEMCPNGTKEQKSAILKEITYHSTGFMRAMQARKKFIYNHPQKIEIVKEIIKYRSDKKIVTFNANTAMAESIGIGFVYTGKDSKKKNRITLDEFIALDKGVINTCKLANEGFDCPGLSVGIVTGVNSSSTTSIQRTGRVIRKEGTKYAEMFTLVIEDSVECEWFKKSHSKSSYITIDVDNLIKLLKGEDWEPYKKKLQNFTYRF